MSNLTRKIVGKDNLTFRERRKLFWAWWAQVNNPPPRPILQRRMAIVDGEKRHVWLQRQGGQWHVLRP